MSYYEYDVDGNDYRRDDHDYIDSRDASRRVRFDDDRHLYEEGSRSPPTARRFERKTSPRRAAPPRPAPRIDREYERQRLERERAGEQPRVVPYSAYRQQSRSPSRERTSYVGAPPPPPPPRRRPPAEWDPSDDDRDEDDGIRIFPNSIPRSPYRRDSRHRRHSFNSFDDSGSYYSDSDKGLDIRVRHSNARRPPPSPPLYQRSRGYGNDFGPAAYADREYRLRQIERARGRLEERLSQLQRDIETLNIDLDKPNDRGAHAAEQAAAALSINAANHSKLMSERDLCEKAFREQEEKAEPLANLSSRLQNLKLDEADILLQQEKSPKDEGDETDEPEEAVVQSNARYLQYLNGRLLTIQLEVDQVSQEIRSAEAAKDISQRLSLQLSRLAEDIKASSKREWHIRAGRAEDDLVERERKEKLQRALNTKFEERRSLMREFEILKLDHIRLEREAWYRPSPASPPPPPRPPIIINRRRYNDDTDSNGDEPVRYAASRAPPPRPPIIINNRMYDDIDSNGDEPGRYAASRAPPQAPVIINNNVYVDSDSATLSDNSSEEYEGCEQHVDFRRTYKAVEKAGLSVSFPLNKGVRAIHIQDGDGDESTLTSEAKAWKKDKTVLSDGISSTELRVIHAVEYLEDETGVGKTTLKCLDGPRERHSLQSAQMRWLHIQQPSLKFKTLENIVVNCSDIDGDLRRIAVEAMEKVKEKFSGVSECGAYLEPGSILRYIGERGDAKDAAADSRETEPVVFLSSPFLTLQPFSSQRASKFEYRPRSLLQSLYGYDVGSERESGQVVQKLNITKSKKDMLHINQLWCLVIGSKILITMSEQSSAQIRGDSIVMDAPGSNSKEPLVVRLTDRDDREYRMVVERDCNYVDFLIYAVARVAGQDANAPQWDLFDENYEVLTPNRWMEIMGSTDGKLRSFSVKERLEDDIDSEASERDAGPTCRRRTQSRSRSRAHTSRPPAYLGRAVDQRIVSRRSRSQYDLRDRRSASRPRSYHGGYSGSRSMVSVRDRLGPARPYTSVPRISHASETYGSRSLVVRDRHRDREYSRGPSLSANAGVLVPYRGQPSQIAEPSGEPDRLSGTGSSVADAEESKSSNAGEDLNDNDGASSPSSSISHAESDGNNNIKDDVENHKWSHLSDIAEERSSSAPTPKVGAASEHDGSTSSSNGDHNSKEEPGSEMSENDRDPRNMQLILRPKGLGLEPESLSPIDEPPASEHSGVTIDIGEPWREMLEGPASVKDDPHTYDIPEGLPSPGPSHMSGIDRNMETFDRANQFSRPILSPAEEALHKEGAALHILYIRFATAQRRGDHAIAAHIRHHQLPAQELVIQKILRAAAALPEEWEISRDLETATETIEHHKQQQQQEEDVYDHNQVQVAVVIITQEKIIRRLQIIKTVLSSDDESKLAEASRNLEDLRNSMRTAEAEGDFTKAADLKYYMIPEAEAIVNRLSEEHESALQTPTNTPQPPTSDTDGRLLNQASILHWAHGRGHFNFAVRGTTSPAGSQEVESRSPFSPDENDGTLVVWQRPPDPSPPRPLRRKILPLHTGRRSGSVSSYAGRSQFDLNERIRIHNRALRDRRSSPPRPRYYETPRRSHVGSRSSSRYYASPSSRSSPSSESSVIDMTDDETLAPGVILNELPRPRRHMPEVYDINDEPKKPGPDRPTSREAETRERSLNGDSSSTTESYHNYDPQDTVHIRSFHTEKLSDQPISTEVARYPSSADASRFRRTVLRRYAPTAAVDFSRIKLAPDPEEIVEDEEADGAFARGCRIFYRRTPKPRPGEEVDWTDEYVIDQKDLPFYPGAVLIVPVQWPPLPDADEFKATPAVTFSLDPFLRWRVKSSDQERTPEQIDRSVLRVLGNMDKSLQGGNFYQLYTRTFMCTLKDLFERHDFLTHRPKGHDPVIQAADGGDVDKPEQRSETEPHNGEDATIGEKAPLDEPTTGLQEGNDAAKTPPEAPAVSRRPSSSTGSQKSEQNISKPSQGASDEPSTIETSSRQGQSMGTLAHDQIVLKRLLEVSEDLISTYMPAEGSPLLNSVCQHFWGNVDEIFRSPGRRLACIEVEGGKHTSFATSMFPQPSLGERTKLRTRRSPGRAVCNVHAGGVIGRSKRRSRIFTRTTSTVQRVQQPYDDPCFVWLRQLHVQTTSSVVNYGNVVLVEDFITQLLLISRYSKELHNLVASIHGKTSPQLPTNVVLAFEQIMAMYMIQAHKLSLTNARGMNKIRSYELNEKIDELVYRGELARRHVMDHLTEAKKDIILLRGTSRQIDSLSVEAVGAEFLVLSLMTNLQNRPLVNKPEPLTSEKADFVELYRRYTSSLRFQANRRPKKRVFLDIHGLEEELDALHSMLGAQKSLLCNYLKLLSPGSTRATNATRVGQYNIERAYARKQQKILDAKEEGIRILREKSGVLKEQVKKTIEILEEDHGKAIRVFTFVTLLFLPLSFVTSFMGMNTVDVRDTEWSQKIFWATGLPVTIIVVIFALIYAYRGERIQDWVLTNVRPKGRHMGRSMGGSFAWSGEPPADGDTFLVRGGLKKRGVFQVDSNALLRQAGQRGNGSEMDWVKDARELLRARQKSRPGGASGMKRRRTGESLAR